MCYPGDPSAKFRGAIVVKRATIERPRSLRMRPSETLMGHLQRSSQPCKDKLVVRVVLHLSRRTITSPRLLPGCFVSESAPPTAPRVFSPTTSDLSILTHMTLMDLHRIISASVLKFFDFDPFPVIGIRRDHPPSIPCLPGQLLNT